MTETRNSEGFSAPVPSESDRDDVAWHADDAIHMRRALLCAADAGDRGEVPVGAVLVAANGTVLAEAGNQQIGANDPTAHAEIVALRTAALAAGNYRLPGSTLYVTLEPCTMCCGALVHARVGRLVFATREPKAGAVISTAKTLDNMHLNHNVLWQQGLLREQASDLLTRFFAKRRAAKKNAKKDS